MAAAPAGAQGRLDARYSVTLAGIPVGEGTWQIDFGDTQVSAAVTGNTVGLLRVFSNGKGTSSLRGTWQGGKPATATYVATIESSKKSDRVDVTVDNGNVKESNVVPPVDPDSERVPLTEDSKHGVLDPLTAAMVRMPGTGNMLVPEACQRSASIFDGKLRYDLKTTFKRMEHVKAEKGGYEGNAVVCALSFTPIAGHVPSRAAIKYLTKQHDIEVWLAPIAGTRILVPFRAEGPTPIGHAVMEATQFLATAMPKEAKAPSRPAPKAAAAEKPVEKPPEKVVEKAADKPVEKAPEPAAKADDKPADKTGSTGEKTP